MSRLLSTLLNFHSGYSWKASNSISNQNKLSDCAAGMMVLIFFAWIGLDSFNEYVDAKVAERTTEMAVEMIDAQKKQEHAEKILVACMNGGAIKTGEWTAIFCDPSKEHRL